MADITAKMVSDLRETTGVSMMECKKALVEAGGDKDKAVTLLRERGMASAQKRAGRATNQGVIATAATDDGKTASLAEINCETDFVARNDQFKAYAAELAQKALATDAPLLDSEKDVVTALIQKTGENMQIRRNIRFQCQGEGRIVSYIHLGAKEGVLVELGCAKAATAATPGFLELGRDLAMHISAVSPRWLERTEVPADIIAAERAIFAKQVLDKPANIVEKIVDGKVNKFYSEVCLIDQPFVKEQKMSIKQLLEAKGKELGDTLTIRRYVRWMLGE
ncbi:MAG: translation elongation factor Ts [Kiritimatiellia bacterium]